MINEESVEARLAAKDVKPTANRILVYRMLQTADRPLSLADFEEKMVTMDKSSIFRVLTLFLEHDIAHAFEDGRGVLNYELCSAGGRCNHADAHIHFYCESCHRSFCMNEAAMPDVQLPPGFTLHTYSFVVKGECAECRRRASYRA